MEIKTTYIGKLNGVYGMWTDTKPAKAEIKETKQILVPQAGYVLIRKKDREKFDNMVLSDKDSIDNYIEERLF